MNDKITQQIAATTQEVASLAKKVGGFLNKVVGDAAMELGGAAHDWSRLIRYKNLLRINDKIEEIHRSRKLEGKSIPIPPRYAIPLLQAASAEDDGTIQGMWAGLIANASDPNGRLEPKKIFIDILSSAEPLDIQILDYMSRQNWLMFRDVPNGGISVEKLTQELKSSEKEIWLSLQNLHRLGCIIDEFESLPRQYGTTSFGQRITDPETSFRPSPLGHELLEACSHSDDK